MTRPGEPARVGVLLSGRGSNLVALAEGIDRGRIPARIVLVVSNRADAAGLHRARERGFDTRVLPHREHPSREAHDEAVVAALREADVDWVCLAGYLRLLSSRFVAAFPQRILNVHPSLLPAFPGLEAQQQAWEHGVRVAGCTVHLVDEELDHGPIVVQRAVPVLDSDGPGSLADRILVEEHQAYPEALERLLREPWTVVGRRVVFGLAAL